TSCLTNSFPRPDEAPVTRAFLKRSIMMTPARSSNSESDHQAESGRAVRMWTDVVESFSISTLPSGSAANSGLGEKADRAHHRQFPDDKPYCRQTRYGSRCPGRIAGAPWYRGSFRVPGRGKHAPSPGPDPISKPDSDDSSQARTRRNLRC